MKEILPSFGIEVTEIPRLETGGKPVSASRVRELLKADDLEGIRELVPTTTFEGLKEYGRISGFGIHGERGIF
jgi:[citrate (pro-3S)-lyase] ligase